MSTLADALAFWWEDVGGHQDNDIDPSIEGYLEYLDDDKGEAAARLGVSRRQVERWVERYRATGTLAPGNAPGRGMSPAAEARFNAEMARIMRESRRDLDTLASDITGSPLSLDITAEITVSNDTRTRTLHLARGYAGGLGNTLPGRALRDAITELRARGDVSPRTGARLEAAILTAYGIPTQASDGGRIAQHMTDVDGLDIWGF